MTERLKSQFDKGTAPQIDNLWGDWLPRTLDGKKAATAGQTAENKTGRDNNAPSA